MPDVELLERELQLRELEFRCGYPAGAEQRADPPKHPMDAMQAHGATNNAFRAKDSTGAPSRALELKAAEAHDKAAASAKEEKRSAAEVFHTAAAAMHRAAASDEYAGDFDAGGVYYRSMQAAAEVERRFNPNHDEKGMFASAEGSSAAVPQGQWARGQGQGAFRQSPRTSCRCRRASQRPGHAARGVGWHKERPGPASPRDVGRTKGTPKW